MTAGSIIVFIENCVFKTRKGNSLTEEDIKALKEIQSVFRTNGFRQNSYWAQTVTNLLSNNYNKKI